MDGATALTVSDAESFTDRGGMVGLFLRDNRLRFTVNRDAVERAGLRISSKALALAESVTGRGQ